MVDEMKQKTGAMQQKLLELISNLSESEGSTSLPLLPAKPKIFHGRELELEGIVEILGRDSGRIAILGPGGMGKTSLAMAALHHPEVAAKYEHQYFVSAESATTSIELATQIGLHLGLKPGIDITRQVVACLVRETCCLLILDNLETLWEPLESRNGVEAFLALLTDIPQLALMITMRGAERPAEIHWTQPFLRPLEPLPYDAALQTFIDIADGSHSPTDINRLLDLTDNMPLAVGLIAHLVDSEGCSSVLKRWETERTSILSNGDDRRCSLNASITVSLSSARIKSLPDAQQLLSLLSILPDGLSDVELSQCRLPIQNVLQCKAMLLGTSLAYYDGKRRVKLLVPIREHIQKCHPPQPAMIYPLRKHFQLLLNIYDTYRTKGAHVAQVVQDLHANHGNIQHILTIGLQNTKPDIAETIYCAISFSSFNRLASHTYLQLIDTIPSVFPQPPDCKLEVRFIIEVLNSMVVWPNPDAKDWIAQGMSHLQNLHDPLLGSRFYEAAGYYYVDLAHDLCTGMHCFQKALTLATSINEIDQVSCSLFSMAWIEWRLGNYLVCQGHAHAALKLSLLSGNLYDEARSLYADALASQALGHYKRTILLSHKARELLGLCGMSGGLLDCSIQAIEAEVHLAKSEYTEALVLHNNMRENTIDSGDVQMCGYALLNIAIIGINTNESEPVVRNHLEEATRIFKASEFSAEIVLCGIVLADLTLREGDTVISKAMLQNLLDKSWGKISCAVDYCLEILADSCRWEGSDHVGTSRWTVLYLAHVNKSQNMLAKHKAVQFLGAIFTYEGDEKTAQTLFTVALEGFTHMDIHQSRAVCMLHLGDLHKRRGDSAAAAEFWGKSLPLFRYSLQSNGVAEIEKRLATL
ncbi:hypothetical protein C8R43DRAFT_120380 [Mycena crocata]|nr:hypothetical protein C8R43DRAFT_120380 [Mycena crocata]